ncbi:MAG: hypothetical protein K6F61_04065 [Clostridiales bacterium]|nr:hypothetical protein [Clostridiales bacterium]
MEKDYVAVEFSGKSLSEVANKMVLFLNSIKGVNLINVKDQADSNGLLQSERSGVHEEQSGYSEGSDTDTKEL